MVLQILTHIDVTVWYYHITLELVDPSNVCFQLLMYFDLSHGSFLTGA